MMTNCSKISQIYQILSHCQLSVGLPKVIRLLQNSKKYAKVRLSGIKTSNNLSSTEPFPMQVLTSCLPVFFDHGVESNFQFEGQNTTKQTVQKKLNFKVVR